MKTLLLSLRMNCRFNQTSPMVRKKKISNSTVLPSDKEQIRYILYNKISQTQTQMVNQIDTQHIVHLINAN